MGDRQRGGGPPAPFLRGPGSWEWWGQHVFSGCPARSLTRQLLGVRPGHRTPAPTEDPQSRGPCRAAPSGPGPSCPGSGSCALEGGLGESCFLRGSSAFSLCYFSVIFLFSSIQITMELEVRKWIEESHKEKKTQSILFTFFFLPDLCFYFLLSEKLPVVYFLC